MSKSNGNGESGQRAVGSRRDDGEIWTTACRQSRRDRQEALDEAIRLHWRDTDREIARSEGVSPTTVAVRRQSLAKRGEILPRPKTGHPLQACLQEVSIFAIEPSPENDTLYDPVREDDPAFVALVKDIKACNAGTSRIRLEKTGEDFHQGGLACAVGAEQPDHLAILHGKTDVVEGRYLIIFFT